MASDLQNDLFSGDYNHKNVYLFCAGIPSFCFILRLKALFYYYIAINQTTKIHLCEGFNYIQLETPTLCLFLGTVQRFLWSVAAFSGMLSNMYCKAVLRKCLICRLCKNNQTAQINNEISRGGTKSRNFDPNEKDHKWEYLRRCLDDYRSKGHQTKFSSNWSSVQLLSSIKLCQWL